MFPSIFSQENQEGQSFEPGSENSSNETIEQGNSYNSKWWHLSLIDSVASTYRCSFEHATSLPVIEFLSIYCYSVDKARFHEKLLKDQYAKLKSKSIRKHR